MPALWQDIYDTSLQLPSFLVFDASLILELSPDSYKAHPHHSVAVSFLKRVKSAIRARKVIALLPIPALAECYHVLCRRVIAPQARASGTANWLDYYKKNPTVISKALPSINMFYKLLQAIPVEIPEPEALALSQPSTALLLADRVSDFMGRFSILAKDAMIIGEAERLGVFTLATLDGDWRRADGFTVIAPP